MSSIIYTSGTTGDPKGVVLTHRNFVANMLACRELFPLGPDDLALSFLPLSHVFERTVDHLFFYQGVALHYSPSIERVAQLLPTVRPTVLASVPRVYERAYLKVNQKMEKESARSQWIFRWAVRVGKKHANARVDRFIGPWLASQRALAEWLVFKKIKHLFGGRLRFAIAGGAPLSGEVAEFFDAISLNLFQGYGMTECSPVIATNYPGSNKRGSVGKPLSGVEVRIAEDGEIQVRGDLVMSHYWENPEATTETIDGDGWLSTGDVGHLDKDGFLYITDRKKDLLVTSGGKNIAPQPIETLLTSHWAISQALVAGDNYPHLTALLVPRFEALPPGLQKMSRDEAIESPEMQDIAKSAIREVNERLPDYERVRKWTLLTREFSEENGELTPTLKVRRRVVLTNYAAAVDSMYLKSQKSQQVVVAGAGRRR
jgi:long-chain acyl-CoA synthetase